jgi:hypothetical protein
MSFSKRKQTSTALSLTVTLNVVEGYLPFNFFLTKCIDYAFINRLSHQFQHTQSYYCFRCFSAPEI